MRTALVLAALVLVVVAGTAYAGPNWQARVTLDLDGLTPGNDHLVLKRGVRGGEDVDVAIYCYNVFNLIAYDIRLSYDPAVVDWNQDYTSKNMRGEGNILDRFDVETLFFSKSHPEDVAVIIIGNAIVDFTAETAPEGEGLMAIVSFTTKAAFAEDDQALFRLLSVELRDSEGHKDTVLPGNLREAGLNEADAVECHRWGQIKATF